MLDSGSYYTIERPYGILLQVQVQVGRAVVDVVNLFFEGNLENLDFPFSQTARLCHQFESIDLLKIVLFSHFCAGSDIRKNFFKLLILGKSRFPAKKVL